MKRSTFFRTTALGALGLGMQPSFAAAPFFQGTSTAQWMANLRAALFVKHRTAAKFSPNNFSRQVALKNAFLEQHNFKTENIPFCFAGTQENFGFYPVLQRSAATGTTEMLLPVFYRDSTGAWKYQKTLNGFQLEALCRAANALSANQVPLYKLLLPVSTGTDAPNKFHTLEGSVTITSMLKAGKVQTRCMVTGSKGILFEETFVSSHGLS